MKKSLVKNSAELLSVFAKSALNELSTIQGGLAGDTHTAPEDTTSSTSDPDTNSSDSDGGPIIIIAPVAV